MDQSDLDAKKEFSRYYLKGSLMEVEEDITHEFKGHRNIAVEEIPPWCVDLKDTCRKTRSAISRNICGFLNSGLGGTIYLGVLDSGEVEGIPLTQYQKDHVKLSLNDTLQRFKPPVPKNLYSLKFVPCVEKGDINFGLMAKTLIDSKSRSIVQTNAEEEVIDCRGWKDKERVNLPKRLQLKYDPMRSRPHTLQTYRYCWCDDDGFARYCHGHTSVLYIIEIIIKPPSATDPEIRKYLHPSSELLIQPIFQAEDGSIYLRRHASLTRRSLNDMMNEAVEEIQHKYFPILKEAKVQLGVLQSLIEAFELMELKSQYSYDSKAEKDELNVM